MSTGEVVEAVVAQLGYGPDAVRGMRANIRTDLNYLANTRKLVTKIDDREAASWCLAL